MQHIFVMLGGPERKEFREVGYRTPGVLAAENGSLIISRVTEDHEGIIILVMIMPSWWKITYSFYTHNYFSSGYYSCQANNGVGPGLSKLIRLIVNGKC